MSNPFEPTPQIPPHLGPGSPYHSPPQVHNPPAVPGQRSGTDEVTSTVIPYRNPPALTAYYLGLFSLSACIPFLGVVGVAMGVAAVVLGIKGLRRVRADPQVHGTVHAWIGIVGGSIFTLLGLVMQGTMI